jgi:hypothetical protein
MSNKKQDLLDQFAMSALTALIAKMPFYDSKAEHGTGIDEDELQNIKKNLTATAYEYAGWMMIAREDNKKWLKENEDVNDDFGS